MSLLVSTIQLFSEVAERKVFSPIKENADDGLLLVPDGSFLLQLCLNEVLGPLYLHSINDLGGVLIVDDAMVQ